MLLFWFSASLWLAFRELRPLLTPTEGAKEGATERIHWRWIAGGSANELEVMIFMV